MLASRFNRNSFSLRSREPLSDYEMRHVAPSIFAEEKHESRSGRYTYIPTSVVLDGLRKEGFQPFMVAQTRVRDESKREFTKHMIRLRHAGQINDALANEVVLLNSHDGTSAYQMLAGVFRFVCSNGLVFGDVKSDIRVRHKGNVVDEVIDGALLVRENFGVVAEAVEEMRSVSLDAGEAELFARSALALKYEPQEARPAPITERQLLNPRRTADRSADLWTTFNRVQENMIVGGVTSRTAQGRRSTTRPVQGIDQGVKLNRALWMLAEGMASLKTGRAMSSAMREASTAVAHHEEEAMA